MSTQTIEQSPAPLRALVTGGVSGIGLATAVRLAQDRGTVGLLDRVGPAPAGFELYLADVTDDRAVSHAVERAAQRMGGLDVLINCAGIGAQGGVEANDDQEWHRVLDVNVVGIARTTRAALPFLRQSDQASIVNVASIASTVGLPDRVLYSASKGAVLAMTLAMATDLLPEGIRVNAVNPGTADTPWIGRLLESAEDPEAERAALEARQPHGRLVSAAEVAEAIAYLASPCSGSTTGTYLAVDGGLQRLRPRPRT